MKKIIILLILAFSVSTLHARTDVNEQLGKLKNNHVNSSENYKNYKENYDISLKNVNEIKEALLVISKLKRDLKIESMLNPYVRVLITSRRTNYFNLWNKKKRWNDGKTLHKLEVHCAVVIFIVSLHLGA